VPGNPAPCESDRIAPMPGNDYGPCDLARDRCQRLGVTVLELIPLIKHEHTAGLIASLADQPRSGLQPRLSLEIHITPVAPLRCETGRLPRPCRWQSSCCCSCKREARRWRNQITA
jgi:hypothetical protein